MQVSLAKDAVDAKSLRGGRWRRNCRGLLNTKKPHAAWEAPQLNIMGGWEDIQDVLVLLLSPPDIPRWPYHRWCSGLDGSLLPACHCVWKPVGGELRWEIWHRLASSAE